MIRVKYNSFQICLLIVLVFNMFSCQKITTALTSYFVSNADSVNLSLPAPEGNISNFDQSLTSDQVHDLDSLILDFENNSKYRINLVSVTSIKPYQTIQEYSKALFNYWKLGAKNHGNDMLIVYSDKLKEISIISGKGIQKKFSEKEKNRIIQKYIHPAFEKGNFYDGIQLGLKKIIKKLL